MGWPWSGVGAGGASHLRVASVLPACARRFPTASGGVSSSRTMIVTEDVSPSV